MLNANPGRLDYFWGVIKLQLLHGGNVPLASTSITRIGTKVATAQLSRVCAVCMQALVRLVSHQRTIGTGYIFLVL